MNQDEYDIIINDFMNEFKIFPFQIQQYFFNQANAIGSLKNISREDKIILIQAEHIKLKMMYPHSKDQPLPCTCHISRPFSDNQDSKTLDKITNLAEEELRKIGVNFEFLMEFYEKIETIKLKPLNLPSKINLIKQYVDNIKNDLQKPNQNLSQNLHSILNSNPIQNFDIDDKIKQIKKQIKNITQKSAAATNSYNGVKTVIKLVKNDKEKYFQALQWCFEDIKKHVVSSTLYQNSKKLFEGNFLVIGPTGAGKSSFINLLDVIAQNAPIANLTRVAIKPSNHLQGSKCSELNSNDQTKTQTQSACHYNFTFAIEDNGFKINIIDTPGLGDVEGIEKDEKNIENILECIVKGSKVSGNALNGIILFLNGTEPRITVQVKYVLNKCRVLIPDTFHNNLFCVCTNVAHVPSLKIKSVCEKFKYNIPSDHAFHMDNNVFQIDWIAKPHLLPVVEENFKKCVEEVKNIFLKCCSKLPVLTNPFKIIGEEQKKMRREIYGLTHELQILQQKLKKALAHKSKIANYELEISEAVSKQYKEDTDVFGFQKKVIDQPVIDQIKNLQNKKDKKERMLASFDNEMNELKKAIACNKQYIMQCINKIKKECKLFNFMEELESGRKVLEARKHNVNQKLYNDPSNKNDLEERDALTQCIDSYLEMIDAMRTIEIKQTDEKMKETVMKLQLNVKDLNKIKYLQINLTFLKNFELKLQIAPKSL